MKRTAARNARRPCSGSAQVLTIELLEERQLLTASAAVSATSDQVRPLYEELSMLAGGTTVAPFASSGPTGYTPAQIRHAYGFDQITFNGGTVAGDGSNETIAIVDAYDDPNIASDLHQFDVAFGLSDPKLSKVNQSGGASMPSADAGWATEIALDVEWAHAIAPKASILLVEANDASYANLMAAVNYARNAANVASVSMSWGGSEFSGETGYDSYFTTPSGHSGVTFFVASGDSGAPAEYPSASPNVVAVGGTTLSLTSRSTISSESAWVDSTGGLSRYESEPTYQKSVVTQTTTARATPDVSYDADPNTGFPVYDSYGTSTAWGQYGGTSDAAPQWAALAAIIDQGRALAGQSALTGSQLLTSLYQLPSSDFHDIVSGSSRGTSTLSASAGFDLVTGRGSPAANLIASALAGSTTSTTSATHFSVTSATTSTAGNSFSITVTALSSSNAAVAGYTGSVHFSSSDVAAGLPSNYSFASTDNGSHTFTVTLKTAGNQSVLVVDTATSSISGSTAVGVSPAIANHLAFAQQPSNATVGVTISPAVTVRVLDVYNNLVSSDNTDQVTIGLGSNPGNATLGGTKTVTTVGGIATFSSLSISAAGTSYALTASSGTLATAASGAFNVTSNATTSGGVIESFESGLSAYQVAGASAASASISTTAAHDGASGLLDANGGDWIYRNDSAAKVQRGDTVSVWLQFSGTADGRAYFGFGASGLGTLSLVAAPNTGQLLLQNNSGYGYTNLAAASQTWLANHWYRLEVDWGTSGTIIAKVFDTNGTTLLQTVTASTSAITSGGIAFRGFGSNKFWDTVTVSPGVNSFAVGSTATPSSSASAGRLSTAGSPTFVAEPGGISPRSPSALLARDIAIQELTGMAGFGVLLQKKAR